MTKEQLKGVQKYKFLIDSDLVIVNVAWDTQSLTFIDFHFMIELWKIMFRNMYLCVEYAFSKIMITLTDVNVIYWPQFQN